MGDNGRQGETRGDKTLDTPTNTGNHATMGDNGRQWEKGRQGETREDKALGRRTRNPTHVVRQWETRGDKTSGRRTHHSTQAHMWGDNGRKAGRQGGVKASGRRTRLLTQAHTRGDNGTQEETRAWEGAHTIRRETDGDKGRQDLRKADTPSKGKQEGAQWETKETKQSGRRTHHPTEGNQNEHNERQRETRPSEGGHTIQQLATRRGTMGDKGRQNPR